MCSKRNALAALTLSVAAFSMVSQAASLSSNLYANKLTSDFDNLDRKNKSTGLKGDFSFRNNQLVEDVGEVVGNQYWGELNVGYQAGQAGDLEKNFSLSTRVNDQENIMFSIPEANIKYRFGDSEVVAGRTVLEWGHIDAVWGFGKLNNRMNFDGFEPGQEGLTGLLYTQKLDGMSFSLFGSVLYVPEMNPGQDYDEDAGKISCSNPWCRPQAETAPVSENGEEVPIYYNIEYPEVADIVLKYSAGARLELEIGGPFKIETFGIRKPENQLSVAAEYYLDSDVGPKGTAIVDITPQVYYHDILGGNVRVDLADQWSGYVGAMAVTPNTYPDGVDPAIVYTGLKPKKKKEDYVGAGAFYEGERLKGGLHYVARVSEYNLEDDTLVEYPRWNQAWNINLSSLITRKINVAFDYKYDMLTEDRLTMFSASYLVTRNMLASAGVNMIGTKGDGKSYWSDFTNNDSVYGSLKVKF